MTSSLAERHKSCVGALLNPSGSASRILGGVTTLAHTDLDDARDSLAYWETRVRQLPRHAVRQRREAREMSARWRTRVAEAERLAYGRGLFGALWLVLAEGRLPQPAQHAGRVAVRRARQFAIFVAVTFTTLVVLAVAAFVALLAAVF